MVVYTFKSTSYSISETSMYLKSMETIFSSRPVQLCEAGSPEKLILLSEKEDFQIHRVSYVVTGDIFANSLSPSHEF